MNKMEKVIADINEIKSNMIMSGNEISKMVYSISDELRNRNACRDFALKTGMSKASISKMVYAEETRGLLVISDSVSYNTIYKLKDIMCEHVALMLNDGMSEHEIRNTLTSDEIEVESEAETEVESEAETEVESEAEEKEILEKDARVIREQIIDMLAIYDISKDDMRVIKSLLKSLR